MSNWNDFGDVGEIWFGALVQRSIVERSCHWHSIKQGHPTIEPCKCSVLEIGTGNGQLLRELSCRHSFSSYTGVDYVDEAIELASKSTSAMKSNDSFSWKVADFLSFSSEDKYSLIFDKGTFDAITLGASAEKPLDVLVAQYVVSLSRVALSPTSVNGGAALFVIVSCNWTMKELHGWFDAGLSMLSWLILPYI